MRIYAVVSGLFLALLVGCDVGAERVAGEAADVAVTVEAGVVVDAAVRADAVFPVARDARATPDMASAAEDSRVMLPDQGSRVGHDATTKTLVDLGYKPCPVRVTRTAWCVRTGETWPGSGVYHVAPVVRVGPVAVSQARIAGRPCDTCKEVGGPAVSYCWHSDPPEYTVSACVADCSYCQD